MEAYMYKYTSPGQWWGSHTGLRNVYTNAQLSDDQAVKMAKEDIKKSSGYKDCGVTLLVKYKLSIESQKTYPDIMNSNLLHIMYVNYNGFRCPAARTDPQRCQGPFSNTARTPTV